MIRIILMKLYKSREPQNHSPERNYMKRRYEVYKLKQAAKITGVSTKEVIKAIKNEDIPPLYHTSGGRLVLVDEDIANLVEYFQSIGRIKQTKS